MKNSKRKRTSKKKNNKSILILLVVVGLLFLAIANGCEKKVAEPEEDSIVISVTEEPTAEPVLSRYADIHIEYWELDEMAAIIYLEARNQSAAGQQAVAEVILNRVLYEGFPDTIYDVIHEGEEKGILQFTTVRKLDEAKPTAEQYRAINSALYGEPVLPLDVVFFSRNGENDNVWGKIDDHIFCYAYNWE